MAPKGKRSAILWVTGYASGIHRKGRTRKKTEMQNWTDEDSKNWVENRLHVRIKHPSFGYVKMIERKKWTGEKTGAEFTDDAKEAAQWTCSELRTSQDANGNGIMALLVASYSGLTFEKVS